MQGNLTSWCNGIPLMHAHEHDAYTFQELARAGENFQKAIVAADFAGMQLWGNPSITTDKGGSSCGVALCSPKVNALFDIGYTSNFSLPHRFILTGWHALFSEGVPLGSVYLETCQNPLETNHNTLQEIGNILRELGRPYILGGDWQMSPETLQASGWLQAIKGVVLSCNDFTYESGGAQTELDYFVVHRDLLQFHPYVFKIETQLIPKHSPIVLQFDLDKPMPLISKLVRPTRLPHAADSDHKIGCKEAPPGFDDFGSLAKDALHG